MLFQYNNFQDKAETVNLNRLTYFAAVVDTGSFTKAAERLHITKAVVSQHIAALERETGTTLLIRTTRKVHLTDAGRMLHARCGFILRAAEEAFGELLQSASEPTGILRITAPNDYGIATMIPVVTDYINRYPACHVELALEDRTVDLLSGEIDMAIRIGWLADSSFQARKIGSFRQLLVGSASFADRISALQNPEDLTKLPFIANMALKEPLLWQFSRDDIKKRAVRMQAAIAIDTTPGVLAAVQANGGLSVLPDFLVGDLVVSGQLVHVLPEWRLPSGGIYVVYPAARFRPAKVTAFVAMLIEAGKRRALKLLND
jgi:DNA-binding transcriptional LysR family regulator